MKLAAAAALALPLLTAAPAFATVITLDFEAAPSFEPIGDFYASLGVSFGPDALGLQNDALGPYFSNAPSPLGVMAPVGPDATMNVIGGFIEISFAYSSADIAAVDFWSGLDGTGTLLGSLALASNAQAGGCSDSAFCNFDKLRASLELGTRAYSVTFGNAANVAAFDDVALNVPEPTSALLVAIGLVGAAVGRRRS